MPAHKSPQNAPKKLTKDEEKLLRDFSKNVSTKSSAVFYGNAFVVSLIPLWLYWRVYEIDPLSQPIVFGAAVLVVTLAATYLISVAHKNVKFVLKHKIALKRQDAVSREINAQLADDKKLTRKEKDDRILWKKNGVSDFEATNYAIFYNNLLFVLFFVVVSFFVLPGINPIGNYVVSVAGSAGLLALLSTGSK